MHKTINIAADSFSSGQIGSKIWLSTFLEKITKKREDIWILGGWAGVTALVLLTRGKLNIGTIRSFDIDEPCENIADTLLNYWVWQSWTFKAFTRDCNTLDYHTHEFGPPPSLIINTSCEHFEQMEWFDNIPPGTTVALQSNNMNHDDHTSELKSLEDMKQKYPLSYIEFEGTKTFQYTDWAFDRYMLIGKK